MGYANAATSVSAARLRRGDFDLSETLLPGRRDRGESIRPDATLGSRAVGAVCSIDGGLEREIDPRQVAWRPAEWRVGARPPKPHRCRSRTASGETEDYHLNDQLVDRALALTKGDRDSPTARKPGRIAETYMVGGQGQHGTICVRRLPEVPVFNTEISVGRRAEARGRSGSPGGEVVQAIARPASCSITAARTFRNISRTSWPKRATKS